LILYFDRNKARVASSILGRPGVLIHVVDGDDAVVTCARLSEVFTVMGDIGVTGCVINVGSDTECGEVGVVGSMEVYEFDDMCCCMSEGCGSVSGDCGGTGVAGSSYIWDPRAVPVVADDIGCCNAWPSGVSVLTPSRSCRTSQDNLRVCRLRVGLV